ncbi:DNA primase catalytic subunit PriS [Halolamina salifodinae]|uniref:DNA primase small subunit PriS n=1 Tax=Halolamina salifodinae TaxID=1202767 RepID=A0A8T4GXD0_9EURY|nr:DNA primase catalytic subunit PriS [Halolamina salifodinae]MBP1987616.1 DNA primase small subunit [Halolamina salifodinae]
MEDRTRSYLEGRFGDYYADADLSVPPAPDAREWGHIPYTESEGTTMVRHRTLLDMGGDAQSVQEFLERSAPRHAYFSAARYDDPRNRTMVEKGWRGADLVFDLDADHLPGVDEAEASYAEMLEACKDALQRLLDLLREDFGFAEEDLLIVFSGGRGYHVHVRNDALLELDSEARREIVDYVRAVDLDREGLIRTVSHGGTTRRELKTRGGWGRRVHRELVEFLADIREMEREDALEELTAFDGIGDGRAGTILDAAERNPGAIREGNVEAGGPGLRKLVEALTAQVVQNETAPIDEPVTTDVRRLIRLPGTLHGGTGFVVKPIAPDELDEFDPLTDAVADRFRGQRIMVNVTDPGPIDVGAETTITAGPQSVEEYVGVFLMARGRAEKATE